MHDQLLFFFPFIKKVLGCEKRNRENASHLRLCPPTIRIIYHMNQSHHSRVVRPFCDASLELLSPKPPSASLRKGSEAGFGAWLNYSIDNIKTGWLRMAGDTLLHLPTN